MSESLGQSLDLLAATIASRAGAAPGESYTAKLLAQGTAKCAKKLGEEAVEAALAAVEPGAPSLAAEAADVLYHLLVTLAAAGVSPEAVAAELARRRGVSGIAEKASRPE